MRKDTPTDSFVIRSFLLGSFPEILCAISTRNGGVSPPPLGMNLSFHVGDERHNVERNRQLFFSGVNIGVDALAIPGQVHGSVVRRVAMPGNYADTDALTTNVRGLFLCVTVADCVPVFLFDSRSRAVAGIHAGWRGTSDGISTKAVQMMTAEFGTGPDDLFAFVGPAASACCYSVGEDVASRFDGKFLRRAEGKTFVDLKGANVEQLRRAGMSSERMEVSPQCTITEAGLFHSFRREKEKSGRMMGVIGLTL